MQTEAEYREQHPGVLRVYDVVLDCYRDATQTDLDNLNVGTQAYGRLRDAFIRTQDWVMETVKKS